MTRKEWALVTAVLGLGVLAQIPGHVAPEVDPEHRAADHDALATVTKAASPGSATVSLHVTGMT